MTAIPHQSALPLRTVTRPSNGAQLNVVNGSKKPKQAIIIQLVALTTLGKKLANGPHAYRSAAFVQWKNQSGELYKQLQRAKILPNAVNIFEARRFGKSNDVLTETQIFANFKRDMTDTLVEMETTLLKCKRQQNPPIKISSEVDKNTAVMSQRPRRAIWISAAVGGGLLAFISLAFAAWI